MKTLEDLFFGNDIPFAAPALNPDEYHRLITDILEMETPLLASMTPEQRSLYERYHSSRSALTISEQRDAFVRGFRLGVRVLLESLTDHSYISANSES